MFYKTNYTYAEHPTMDNTDKGYYNCGGYALGLFKWYIPAPNWDYHLDTEEYIKNGKYKKGTTRAVKYMCEELGLEVIPEEYISEKFIDFHTTEVIAFRFETNPSYDFHFMKLAANGCWYEKRGGSYTIYRHPYDYVFGTWCGRYDGPIVYLARSRKGE